MSAPSRRSGERVGIAASGGIAIGPALVLSHRERGVPRRRIAPSECDAEWQRFEDAVAAAQGWWRNMLVNVDAARPEFAIFDAYVQLANDELLRKEVDRQIRVHRRAAEWAVDEAAHELANRLFSVDDPYIRERGQDIDFVGRQLVRALLSEPDTDGGVRASLRVVEPSIVVASELSPADAVALSKLPVLGFATGKGTRTSHTAILARALGIPTVVGLGGALAEVVPGQLLVLDGGRGTVLVEPTEDELEEAIRRSAGYQAEGVRLLSHRADLCRTSDDVRVRLVANVGHPDEASTAVEQGAEGIGLYRTEFLYVDRSAPPTEEEQYAAFARVATVMKGCPVTLRTFDLGGDKFVSSLLVPRELNPLLGLRGVRLQLARPELLRDQLVAMVRASALGDVRVLVPMVTTVDEIDVVRCMLEDAMKSVASRGLKSAEHVALGAMIEVPASALAAEQFAAAVDFLSIGTNDLVQYALAVDRSNRQLSSLASPFHPAVLRLIREVVEGAGERGCPVAVCGEIASEPMGALMLTGLGVRELSMEPRSIPGVKAVLAGVSESEVRDVARQALTLRRPADVLATMEDAFGERLRRLLGGERERFS